MFVCMNVWMYEAPDALNGCIPSSALTWALVYNGDHAFCGFLVLSTLRYGHSYVYIMQSHSYVYIYIYLAICNLHELSTLYAHQSILANNQRCTRTYINAGRSQSVSVAMLCCGILIELITIIRIVIMHTTVNFRLWKLDDFIHTFRVWLFTYLHM